MDLQLGGVNWTVTVGFWKLQQCYKFLVMNYFWSYDDRYLVWKLRSFQMARPISSAQVAPAVLLCFLAPRLVSIPIRPNGENGERVWANGVPPKKEECKATQRTLDIGAHALKSLCWVVGEAFAFYLKANSPPPFFLIENLLRIGVFFLSQIILASRKPNWARHFCTWARHFCNFCNWIKTPCAWTRVRWFLRAFVAILWTFGRVGWPSRQAGVSIYGKPK